MEIPGSSRSCQNADDKPRNDEECQLSKASALRELEKARVRECQMEKTVRWWTVCTAGWRKKWSKLRQENEELRKQIKTYKAQLNDMSQECTTLNSKIEVFDAHNTFLKSEINKLLLKYEDENNDRILEILKTPEVVKQNNFICANCRIAKESPKTLENSLDTPDTENQIFPENDEKYSLLDDSMNDGKNVEMLTEMIAKIFGELQTLKGEFVKNNDGADYKEMPELFVTSDQISQLKIYALGKQLDKEKSDKKRLIKKLEQANEEISKLNVVMKDAKLEEIFINNEAQISFDALCLSEEE